MNFERENTCSNECELFTVLNREYPDQINQVFSQANCDIDPTFLGFIDTYEALSKLIPKYWTVIDIGCGYAAQAYYFKDHKLYLGVDPHSGITFHFDNTVIWNKTIRQTCLHMIGMNLKEFFCIFNYVPCSQRESERIRKTFPNLYCYYPHGGSISMIVNNN